MAERRDSFMVQAPGLCVKSTGQGGKPNYRMILSGMGQWRADPCRWSSCGRSLPTAARVPLCAQFLQNRKTRNAFKLALIKSHVNRRRQATLADALATVEEFNSRLADAKVAGSGRPSPAALVAVDAAREHETDGTEEGGRIARSRTLPSKKARSKESSR
jgi:hypothetical protein